MFKQDKHSPLLSLIIAAILLTVFFSPVTSFAQEWSPAQKEIISFIETNWKNLAEKKTDKFMETIHPQFQGFDDWCELPIDREILKNGIERMAQTKEVVSYKIEPCAINIQKDVVIVYYRCDLIELDENKNKISMVYKYTDILIKVDGKWLIIGVHKEKAK